jgi:hypothetical protein
MAISEAERNIPKTGVSSLTLEDDHLTALIAYGEKEGWDKTQGPLMGELYRLRSAGAAQKMMRALSASQNHKTFYIALARKTVSLMQQVRQHFSIRTIQE